MRCRRPPARPPPCRRRGKPVPPPAVIRRHLKEPFHLWQWVVVEASWRCSWGGGPAGARRSHAAAPLWRIPAGVEFVVGAADRRFYAMETVQTGDLAPLPRSVARGLAWTGRIHRRWKGNREKKRERWWVAVLCWVGWCSLLPDFRSLQKQLPRKNELPIAWSVPCLNYVVKMSIQSNYQLHCRRFNFP
jgi:hypothetical protein